MLTITVPAVDYFDEIKEEFIKTEDFVLELEHSLVSLSKWEAEWEKAFLGPDDKTSEETIGYIRAMTLTPNVPSEVYKRLTPENFKQINSYIEAKMTATWFRDNPNAAKSREIITAEIIYYWMIEMGIPVEFENWHLNRLFTLIKVVNQKKSPAKKMSPQEAAAERRALNEARRQKMGTNG